MKKRAGINNSVYSESWLPLTDHFGPVFIVEHFSCARAVFISAMFSVQLQIFVRSVFIKLGVDEVDQDNVYQNLLASIDRENLSGSSITVAVVHALSKKVFLAKNKRRDKAPTTMLSKKQFAHVLVYICNRNVKLDELERPLLRYH